MDLIKIETNPEGKQTVNARDLHKFLESKRDFSNWIKDRIEKGRFIEGEDFTTILAKSNGGRPNKEYHLSTDMGKDIGMLENNTKGDEIRQYFRNCEKKMKGELINPELAMIVKMAQQLDQSQQKQQEQDHRMDLIEAHQTTRPENHFTVAGYCSLKGIQIGQRQAADLGRRCAKLARETGSTVERVTDARFGHVNVYHTDILEEIVC